MLPPLLTFPPTLSRYIIFFRRLARYRRLPLDTLFQAYVDAVFFVCLPGHAGACTALLDKDD